MPTNPILLDTHAAVWVFEDSLKPAVAKEIDLATKRHEVMLSPISAWEIGMLTSRGRLSLTVPVEDYVRAIFQQLGILTAPLTPEIALAATSLPGDFHRDPADRILIATAAAYAAHLMTRDRAILEYARKTRYIRCIAC